MEAGKLQSNGVGVSRNTAAGSQMVDVGLRNHMNRVYGLMAAAVGITGLTAWAFGTIPALTALVFNIETSKMTFLGLAATFAPLLMILVMGFGLGRLSYMTMKSMLFGMAAMMGMSLSTIFLVYTGASIAQTFFVSAAAFAGLSLYGYTTKRDLSGMGAFLVMGLIGAIIASIVNMFLQSSAFDFALTIATLLIFAGLTAHDTQNCKQIYLSHPHASDEDRRKVAVWSALDLYLDFINIFLQLLKLIGQAKSND